MDWDGQKINLKNGPAIAEEGVHDGDGRAARNADDGWGGGGHVQHGALDADGAEGGRQDAADAHAGGCAEDVRLAGVFAW